MNNISIVIPTFNEAQNIQPLLDRILSSTCNSNYCPEVLIVDDGSTDDTRQKILDYDGKLNLRLICRDNERGLASAVIAGACQALTDIVVVMDGDLSHPPEAIPSLVKPIETLSHDMVIGSRYVAGGETPDWPATRRFCSQVASIPARLLTSLKDPLAGFFAVRKELLLAIDSNTPGFKIGLGILASPATAITPSRVLEIPISFPDRNEGISKMDHKVIFSYLQQLVRLSSDLLAARNIHAAILFGLIVGIFDCTILSLLTNNGFTVEESHIFSLLLSTHICYPFYFAVTRKNTMFGFKDSATRYIRFLTIILLGMFFRGGLLSWFSLPQTSVSPMVSLFITIYCTSWICGAIALTIATSGSSNKKINGVTFATLLIGYTILLRLIYLGGPELLQEEAYYWNYSQHLAAGYLDHPPMVALLIKFGTLLFGHNEFGVRIGAFGCWFVTAFFIFKMTKRIFNRKTANKTLLLLATLPIFFCVGLVITPDAPLIASWAGAIFFLYNALITEHTNSWYGAGICLGIGLASKYTIAFLGPAIVLFMLIEPKSRKWFFMPQPYLAALLALTVFSPVIWWNYHHEWASFLFQSQARLQASSEFSTHELLGSILVLLTPTGFIAAVASMRPHFATKLLIKESHAKSKSRSYLFCLTMTLVPLSIFILFSLTKQIKLNWTGPIWLATLPFIAFAMAHSNNSFQAWLNRIWPRTFVVTTLLLSGLLHFMALGLPGIPFAQRDFLFGYDNLAAQVNEELHSLAPSLSSPPIIVGAGKYRLASGLAFYRRKQLPENVPPLGIDDTTGSQLLGYQALMYNYWLPPAKATGRDILVISENLRGLKPISFTDNDPRLGEISSFKITKRGKEAGEFYFRVISNSPENGPGNKRMVSAQSALTVDPTPPENLDLLARRR